MRLLTCLSEWLGIIMSLKRLRVLLECLFLIHTKSFYEEKFMPLVLLSIPFLNVSFLCVTCVIFDHNSNSYPRYVQLKANIENSIEIAFNLMEHVMGGMFNQVLELD